MTRSHQIYNQIFQSLNKSVKERSLKNLESKIQKATKI